MKYFSIFSGIGGFELGIQQAYDNKYESEKASERVQDKRWDGNTDKQNIMFCSTDSTSLCVGYSEIDKYAIQIYEKHFGGHNNYGDATKIIPEQIPDFDLLVGGFPFQAFSIAGRRKGFEDTRGTLFFEIARIIKAKQPGMFLLENVKGLLNHDKGETFTTILKTIDELGYDAEWQVLNSKHFGVPQNRERVFIVGHLRGTGTGKIFPLRESNSEHFREVADCLDANYHKGEYDIKKQKRTLLLQHLKDKTEKLTKYNLNEIVGSLKQPSGNQQNYVLNETRIRRLTPTECERLQGFPDNWTQYGIDEKGNQVLISDTQRYKCLGNAVTVNVIECIARCLPLNTKQDVIQ